MNGKLATSIVLLCERNNIDAGHVMLLSGFCATFWLRPFLQSVNIVYADWSCTGSELVL
jgi:hypothetical protein